MAEIEIDVVADYYKQYFKKKAPSIFINFTENGIKTWERIKFYKEKNGPYSLNKLLKFVILVNHYKK